MSTLVHVAAVASRGGTEIGMSTLFNRGFYAGYDVHAIALHRGSGGMLPDFARSLGAGNVRALVDADESNKFTIAEIPGLVVKLDRAFKEIKPDVVVLSSQIGNIVGRVAALRRPHMRVVTFEHLAAKLSPIVHAGLLATSFRCNAIFGDTPETLQAMAHYQAFPRPAYDVPLSILQTGTPRKASQPPTIKIIAVGRLADQKNYGNLIPAVAALRAEGRKIELDIYGEGPLHAELSGMIGRLGMKDYIRLNDFVASVAGLGAIRDAAHIQVMPSTKEGFCLAVAEGLASGVPSVATDVGGMKDYGVHGLNMLKIPKDRNDPQSPGPDAIAATIRPLIDRYATLAPVLSAGGIATAKERFSERAVHEKWQQARAAFAPAEPRRRFYALRNLLQRSQSVG